MNAVVYEAWKELTATTATAPELLVTPLPTAWGDRALFRQVWVNLLSNVPF